MRFWKRAARELRFMRGLLRTLKRVKSVSADSSQLPCDDFEDAVDQFRDRPAMIFEGRTVSYGDLDGIANRYANWAKGRGIKRGDTVALLMQNRVEYLPIWLGLSRSAWPRP